MSWRALSREAVRLTSRRLRFWRRALRYALSRSPRAVARRGVYELLRFRRRQVDARTRNRLREGRLLPEIGINDVGQVWVELASRPYLTTVARVTLDGPQSPAVDDARRVLHAADRALDRHVEILGSDELDLGKPVDWVKDYKSGVRWPAGYAPLVDYSDLGRESDVKVPWEISRLQWLIPAGLAYRLTADERYPAGVREILEEWMEANPFGMTVNWAIAMEAALRFVTWSWFFHVFAKSQAWADEPFRKRFLSTLYAHGDFVDRHIERSDVNGNHYTADAMGLNFAGLFFGSRGRAPHWERNGWRILVEEIGRQVHADGVDFEASSAYHRFVAEMFALSALYRQRLGLPVDGSFKARLVAMGRFAAAYTRSDGSSPLWGDADNGRVLPLGAQSIADHRYLSDLIAVIVGEEGSGHLSPDGTELFWLTGRPDRGESSRQPSESVAFPAGGVYVMRSARDHVFVDCGPVGMAGRGGHGHNDCLSFEAVLEGDHLISDSGTYTYTGSVSWRNRFRATPAHNTPMIDGQELNRFVDPHLLWVLHDDAVPEVIEWHPGFDEDVLRARHSGYRRLREPVTVDRRFRLQRQSHVLTIEDTFLGRGEHEVRESFHLAIGVDLVATHDSSCVIARDGRQYVLRWSSPALWEVAASECWISSSYGRKARAVRIELRHTGELVPVTIALLPHRQDRLSSAEAQLAGGLR